MREYQKARRAKLSSQGMCKCCCSNPATPGFATCDVCRTRSRQHMYNKKPRKRHTGIHSKIEFTKPSKPIICPLCDSIPSQLYWHHWDNNHPELGMWLCPYCNIIVELEEKGLVEKYKKLKEEIIYIYNCKVLESQLSLRFLEKTT